MKCHICSEPPIGMCQSCWKFYCSDHGDVVCQACKDRVPPWSESMGFPAGGSFIETSGDEPPSRADIEAWARAAGMPVKRVLQRVIPAVQSQTIGEVQITIASLEIYDGAFTAQARVKNFRERKPDSGLSGMIGMPRLNFEASDDQGGHYAGMQGGGGGSENEWKFEIDFTPSLNPDARTLTVTVTEIHWFAFGPGQQSRVEPGPWRFEIPLT